MVSLKGLTYEERYGKVRADLIREKIQKARAGKSSGMKGKVLSIEQRKKMSEKRRGVIRLQARKIKNMDIIKITLQNFFKYENNHSKTNFLFNKTVKNVLGSEGTIRNALIRNNLTLENIAQDIGESFDIKKGRIGKNESIILDKIEQEKEIKFLRQYYIKGCYIDGYDPINNIAYEVDEGWHKNRMIEDYIREQKIKTVLSCDFVRIKDNW